MNPQKTAILVDSCMDVPQAYIDRFNMYVIPVRVIYQDREYADRVDITPQEVYDRLPVEVPKTSLPDTGSVVAAFDDIVAAGYERVLCITISSGLSGTNNLINLVARDYPQLDIRVIDTLNIGIAVFKPYWLRPCWIEKLSAIAEKVEQSVKESKVFFCLSSRWNICAAAAALARWRLCWARCFILSPLLPAMRKAIMWWPPRCADVHRPLLKPLHWLSMRPKTR